MGAEWSSEMGAERSSDSKSGVGWSSDLGVGWNLEQWKGEMGCPLTLTRLGFNYQLLCPWISLAPISEGSGTEEGKQPMGVQKGVNNLA